MNYVPVNPYYVVLRTEVRWERGEAGPCPAVVELLGDVIAVDDEGCVMYIGAGRPGSADGRWHIEVNPSFVQATAHLVLPSAPDDLAAEFPAVWGRLVREMESRGVHELAVA